MSLVVVPVVVLAGCGRQPGAHDTPSDAPGQTASETPPRIVALLPFAADQLIEMGVRPAGVPALRGDVPAAWGDCPTIAIDHTAGPNIEQIIAARPDVVVTSSVYAAFNPAIERATHARVVVMDVESVDDIGRHVRTLGELCGRGEAGERLASELESVHAGTDAAGAKVRTLAVFGTPHAFYAFLPDSYLGDVIARCGGELITSDLESHPVFRGMAPLSMEAVMQRDPDLLVVVFHGSEGSARAMLEANPLWAGLRCVRDGHVAFLRDDLYAMRPGSEAPRAFAEIGGIIDGARP